MSNRDHGFLHPSNSISQRSAVSTHSHASGISGFLSNLARTVSNASSSSYGSSLQHQHSGNQSKILSPDSTFTGLSSGDRSLAEYDPAREPIKAFLRIRPPLGSGSPAERSSQPYLQVVDDTVVSLASPSEVNSQSATSAPVYKFTRVFDGSTSQADFFTDTTLPMVADALGGSSGLLFTYGVTNSGKTYTVQGTPQEPGLLPRTFDVLFNSIKGKMSTSQFRPAGFSAVETIPSSDRSKHSVSYLGIESAPASRSGEVSSSEAVHLDDRHQYSIWVSFAEVYNEKAFDLLDGPTGASSSSASSSFSGGSLGLGLGLGGSRLLPGSTVKRKALSIKSDKSGTGKYISGLREIRVFNAQEARAVLRKGQQSRRVFSTLLNKSSSRSHSIFTIKVIRNVDGREAKDVKSASISSLSIVDLAGSERTSNTGTSGDRLREAGNINKSLMVLGQCMEVLRRNQISKEKGKKQAIVPFRHSKLTELFQSYFTGEGRVTMIVNVNPYDTGMEENMHVMKFASVARQVVTLRSPPPPERTPTFANNPDAPEVKGTEPASENIVVSEEPPDESDEDDEEPEDPLVTYLFDVVEEQRQQLYELKLREAMANVHAAQSTHDMIDVKLRENDKLWNQKLQDAIRRQEEKANAKIDILTQAHAAQLEELQQQYEQAEAEGEEDAEPSSSDESHHGNQTNESSTF